MNDLNDSEVIHPVLLREIVSRNLNFKGMIFKVPEEEKFEVSVYEWHEDDGEEIVKKDEPLWERVSGPFIVDTLFQAEKLAAETLRLLAGETPDSSIPAETAAWIREYSGDEEAEYLDPRNFKGRILISGDAREEVYEPLEILRVIALLDLYIIEGAGSKWHLGMLKKAGEIDCWATFKSLAESIDTIKPES